MSAIDGTSIAIALWQTTGDIILAERSRATP